MKRPSAWAAVFIINIELHREITATTFGGIQNTGIFYNVKWMMNDDGMTRVHCLLLI